MNNRTCGHIFNRHRWTHDTQGAEYCARCLKFRRWLPGTVRWAWLAAPGVRCVTGWGYLLNGPAWLADMNDKIETDGGYYMDGD